MTAQTVEANDLACGRCAMTTDQCLSLREDCCAGCTHYPEPDEIDVDEIAVARAVAGDTSVSLTRREYAAAHAQCEARGMSAAAIADLLGTSQRNVVRWRNGHHEPYSRKGKAMSDDTIDALLAAAQRHEVGRIKTAARRASDAVQKVRDLLAEDAGKAEARELVERLERELREAKAALGRRPAKPRTVSTGEPLPCRKGCGKTAKNGTGLSAHERTCAYTPGAVA